MRRRFTLLLLLATGLSFSSTAAREQGPQRNFRSDDEAISLATNLVVLNVTITDHKERYISGLKAGEFSILEDKQPQQILSFGFEETSFAAAILLDTSASMEKKLSLERAACADFVTGIRDGDAFAIYGFGGMNVKKLRDFAAKHEIHNSTLDLQAEGNTPLYDAIAKAADALAKRPERRRAILLVSDGADTQSSATLNQAMRKAVAAHVSIYAVDMSDATVYGAAPRDNGAEVMQAMAAKTGGKFFRTPGGNKLREAFANTVNELRHQYTLTYESSNDHQDGRWHSIEVRIARPKLNVRSRQGYYAKGKG